MNADEIPSYFGCSSHDAYLDCMLPGVKVTPGLIFFCVQHLQEFVKIMTPCFTVLVFYAGMVKLEYVIICN